MRTVERIWEAAVTAVWVLPLLAFLVTHVRTPPAGAAPAMVGALALLGIVAPRALGRRYFRVRRWEADGRLYRRLGVHRFGRWVPRGVVMNRFVRRRAGGSAGRAAVTGTAARAALERATRESERTHWWWLFMTAAVTVWAAAIGAWAWAALLMLLNVLLNVYPVLLQRHTRGRLFRITRRQRLRTARARP